MRPLIILLLLAVNAAAQATNVVTLYSDTFEAGDAVDYTLFNPRAGDPGPQIVGPGGGLTSNALQLNNVGNSVPCGSGCSAGEQILYELGPQYDNVHLSFDIWLEDMRQSSAIWFANVEGGFPLGQGPDGGGVNNTQGKPYSSDNVWIHYEAWADFSANTWLLQKNGVTIEQGEFTTRSADDLYSWGIRFGVNAWGSPDATAYLDNIVITSVVPIPAAVWLFGSGLGLLGWLRRRQSGTSRHL